MILIFVYADLCEIHLYKTSLLLWVKLTLADQGAGSSRAFWGALQNLQQIELLLEMMMVMMLKMTIMAMTIMMKVNMIIKKNYSFIKT